MLISILTIISDEKRSMLRVGQTAPEIVAHTNAGAEIRLSAYRGRKNVVLYFYPKDFTSGCTAEACSFRDHYTELEQYDAVIVGVSADDAGSHSRFASTYGLQFTFISDDGSISKQYGTRWLWGLLAQPKRVTYVVDKEGIIRGVFHHELAIGKHLDDVLAVLRKIQ